MSRKTCNLRDKLIQQSRAIRDRPNLDKLLPSNISDEKRGRWEKRFNDKFCESIARTFSDS